VTQILAIDIGNTNITAGLFRGDKLFRKKKIPAKAYSAYEGAFRSLRGRGGRACDPDTVLGDDDRLELLRPLQVDPKEARRLRYRRDGLKRPKKTG